jgi:hypothetical protein
MIKKLNELDRNEKLLLISAIKSGEVDRKTINDYTLFACEYSDYFLGLIKSATAGVTLICLGKAVKARKAFFDRINA